MPGKFDAISPATDISGKTKPVKTSKTFSRNVGYSLARVAVNSLLSLILPAYLTHHLPVKTYGAWVLILQLSAYVSYLDFGVQTAVSKYVAEYEAKGDRDGAGHRASAGLFITLIASAIGIFLIAVLAWRVPHLFQDMPSYLHRDVRIGLMLVGTSLAAMLASSVFSAIFLGLQRFSVPMIISIINKALLVVVVCSTVTLHGSLVIMGAGAAVVNVSTALLQIAAWRKLAGQIRVSLFGINWAVLKEMLGYCGVLAIWQAGMLCVSGLDVTIVGHYDFAETAYYSIATLPTTLILSIIVATLGPLMPATSALSTRRDSVEMGNMLGRTTRYSTILLLLTGLPLIVCGFYIIRCWVGPAYAVHTVRYLRILILANVIRNICLPYATMVIATGKQKFATVAAISEAIVNVVSSIFLASRLGAAGVALGTLLGAVVSVSMHFMLSMRNTRKTLELSRFHLFIDGIIRPSMIAVPSILLLPLWYRSNSPFLSPQMCLIWGLGTLLFAWFGSLDFGERSSLVRIVRDRISSSTDHN